MFRKTKTKQKPNVELLSIYRWQCNLYSTNSNLDGFDYFVNEIDSKHFDTNKHTNNNNK